MPMQIPARLGRRFRLRLLAGASILAAACGGDASPTDTGDDPAGSQALTDAQVFAMAQAQSTWTWYKNRADTLSAGSNSPHGRFRTRYNPKAAALLDGQGKVRTGASFPDSALIVKEIYAGGSLSLLAVMLKMRSDANARQDGWLWGEYSPSGQAVFSVAQSSGICTGCHGPGIDFTRMNDAHP